MLGRARKPSETEWIRSQYGCRRPVEESKAPAGAAAAAACSRTCSVTSRGGVDADDCVYAAVASLPVLDDVDEKQRARDNDDDDVHCG